MQTPVSEIASVIPPCDSRCEHLSCEMQRGEATYTPAIEEKIKVNVTPRPFKGTLLKPKDKTR